VGTDAATVGDRPADPHRRHAHHLGDLRQAQDAITDVLEKMLDVHRPAGFPSGQGWLPQLPADCILKEAQYPFPASIWRYLPAIAKDEDLDSMTMAMPQKLGNLPRTVG